MVRSRRIKGGTPTRKNRTKTPKSKTPKNKSPRSMVTRTKKRKSRKNVSRLGQYFSKKGEFGWIGTNK